MEKYKRISGKNYCISNLCNVKHKGRILKPHDNGKGYKKITINYNGLLKQKYIHRLVAEAFLPNKDKKQCIDHIDCDKSNNRVENLRWVTYTENNLNPITNFRMKISSIGKCSKKIIAKKLSSILEFDSIIDASRELNIHPTSISKCLHKHRKQAGGYIFFFVEPK